MARKYNPNREEIRCGLGEYQAVLKDILAEFGEEAREAVVDAVEETGKQLVKDVKKASPKKGGRYKAGWRCDVKEWRTDALATVYNKDAYQLTHLLEFGHALYIGGRHVGEVPPKVHMAPVQDEAGDVFARKLREIMT